MRRAIATAEGRLELVGRDVTPRGALPAGLRRATALAVGIALLAALAVAALRIDLIRVRYGLADAVRQERALLEERRAMLAEVRALRDPQRLTQLAQQQGFVRPTRIRTLSAAPPGPLRP